MSPGAPAGARTRPTFGVDIGGTKVLGVALDADGSLLAEARVATPHVATGAGPAGRVVGSEVAHAVAEVVGRLHAMLPPRAGGTPAPVGVGVPGMLDHEGVLRYAPNLLSASGADMSGLLEGLLPATPVVIENDANCAVVAEHAFGAARGFDDVVMATLGTGIGGGILLGGSLVGGGHGFAGEIGHMVVDPAGPPCPCGSRGCWERYASGGGLGRLALEAALAGHLVEVVELAGGDPEAVRGEHVTRAALEGDPGARAVLEELGWWVALGLSNLAAVVDPELFVLGGGLAEAGDLLVLPTRRAYATLVEGGDRRPPVGIVVAELGERAGAVGAALRARRALA